jgi:uncharacterized membrane protein (UPF0127 family)
MSKMKKLLLALIVVAIVTGVFFWWMSNIPPVGRPLYQRSTLTITRADGKNFPFTTELALSEPEQAYGLMFIKSLPEDQAMLFPFDPPREVIFWMKDTFIPLDMLFVRPNHTIGRIVTNARPLDLTPISSEEPVIAVIEIRGGQVVHNGFTVGDKVVWPLLTAPPAQ